MRSCLLAIGCDYYEELRALQGAEADARRVFDGLTSAQQSYGSVNSRLLLSPTKAKVDATVRELAGTDPIDVLTLYFAGHGAIVAGSYYLCLRDSNPNFLSGTALSLSSWLNIVKELRPRYAYIVMDACFSGGGHYEIGNLLNDPLLGCNNASTFACLAAASADQYALETSAGGAMTNELMKITEGRVATSVERADLDLLDVARTIGERMSGGTENQKPVAWGLNLFGPGRFCRNPLFTTAGHAFHIPDLASTSPLADRVRRASDEIWAEYRAVGKALAVERLRSLVIKLVADAPATEAGVFVFGLANAFIARIAATGREWDVVETCGLFAVILLPHVASDPAAAEIARELLNRKTRLELDLTRKLCGQLETDPLALINRRSAMAEYFYLPLRLTKLLAWSVHTIETARFLGLTDENTLTTGRRLVALIIEHYGNALRAVCDQQASYLFVWFHYARSFGWTAEIESVFGAIFCDFIAVRGRVARGNIAPEIAFEYCVARSKDPMAIELKWIANPCQLLAVLLVAASDNALSDVVDPHLTVVDRRHLNLFFPANYKDYAVEVIGRGINRGHCIGLDVWTCADYQRLFSADLARHMADDGTPRSDVECALGVVASLLFPDRVPLFLRTSATGPAT